MKNFFLISLIISTLWAVKIEIVPDNNFSVLEEEIQNTIKKFLQERYIKIDRKVAEKIIKENRILSNNFIEEYSIPQDLIISFRLSLEENLANLYVKKKQKNIKINKEMLESYYKTHPKLFQEDQKIHFTAYKFKSFKDALKFYQTHKIVSNALIEKKDVILKKSKINPVIVSLFEKVKEGEITPPVFYKRYYVVFKVKTIEPSKQLSFEESKEKIRNILLQKIFLRTKKELLNK